VQVMEFISWNEFDTSTSKILKDVVMQ